MKQGIVAVFTLAMIFHPVSVKANSILRQLARTGLTQDDINIMARAAADLYASGDAKVGSDTIWANSDTGAYGLVEVLAVQGDCVRLSNKFRTRQRTATQSVTTQRCLDDGRWVLTP